MKIHNIVASSLIFRRSASAPPLRRPGLASPCGDAASAVASGASGGVRLSLLPGLRFCVFMCFIVFIVFARFASTSISIHWGCGGTSSGPCPACRATSASAAGAARARARRWRRSRRTRRTRTQPLDKHRSLPNCYRRSLPHCYRSHEVSTDPYQIATEATK